MRVSYMASSCGYLFSPVLTQPHSCVCAWVLRGTGTVYTDVCAPACVYLPVCVFIMHLHVHHVSSVTMCACNLHRSFLPGSITPLLLHDKCEVLWCMCGLKMKKPTGRYWNSTFCFQTHHYRYGYIDCLLGFLFFLCACFVLFSSQLPFHRVQQKMTLGKLIFFLMKDSSKIVVILEKTTVLKTLMLTMTTVYLFLMGYTDHQLSLYRLILVDDTQDLWFKF